MAKTVPAPIRPIFLALHLAALLALGVFLVIRFVPGAFRFPEAARVYGEVPDFELVERSGRPVSRADLLGRPWIADFIFTRCQGQCLVMNAQGRDLRRDLPAIKLVSFSVDPAHDTPDRLAEYAERWSAGPDWLFLTGPAETMNRLTTGLHMNRIDEPMMHSTSFVLVDAGGKVRGYYDANDPDRLETLRRDARAL